jgi:hypothetical protein
MKPASFLAIINDIERGNDGHCYEIAIRMKNGRLLAGTWRMRHHVLGIIALTVRGADSPAYIDLEEIAAVALAGPGHFEIPADGKE